MKLSSTAEQSDGHFTGFDIIEIYLKDIQLSFTMFDEFRETESGMNTSVNKYEQV